MLALKAGRRADQQGMLGPSIHSRRTGRSREWSNKRLRPVMVIGELDDSAIPHIARGHCKSNVLANACALNTGVV
jgi:hypothetical protein